MPSSQQARPATWPGLLISTQIRDTPHSERRSAQGNWHVMVTTKPYHELGAGYFTSLQDPEREIRRLIAKLQALGHTVTLSPAA